MDPSLYNGRTCSLLKSQLSTVHHGVKHSQTSRPYILTAVAESLSAAIDLWCSNGFATAG